MGGETEGKRDQASRAAPDEGIWVLREDGVLLHLDWDLDLEGEIRGRKYLLDSTSMQCALLPPKMGPQELSSVQRKGIPLFTSLKSLFTRNCLIKNDFLPRTH